MNFCYTISEGCENMLTKAELDRLNELANIKKTSSLTDSEAIEQASLRKKYLDVFRNGMKETLENTKIIDPEGNDVTPEKIKAIKAGKMVQ